MPMLGTILRSAPINATDVGRNHVTVPIAGGQEKLLLRVEIRLEGSSVFLILEEESTSWPLRVQNDSDTQVQFEQTVSTVAKGTSSRYADNHTCRRRTRPTDRRKTGYCCLCRPAGRWIMRGIRLQRRASVFVWLSRIRSGLWISWRSVSSRRSRCRLR